MQYFELNNEVLRVIVTDLGCRIVSIFCKDREGQMADVVLNLNNIEEDYVNDGAYYGAMIGRVANRIKDGRFSLNGKDYQLAINNGPNALHGGLVGFDKKLFDHELIDQGIIFSTASEHMEEGYPGNLKVKVIYQLEENALKVTYEAISDEDTIINFTNHSYFNLSGKKSSVLNHSLQISADEIAELDETCAVTGKMIAVKETPFDFNEAHLIGERIDEENEQLKIGNGYDHCFILSKKENQIVLSDDSTGRVLTVSTDMPTVQIYTGNFLSGGPLGKGEQIIENREGVAIETQFLPNSINVEKEPKVILKANTPFTSTTIFSFCTK